MHLSRPALLNQEEQLLRLFEMIVPSYLIWVSLSEWCNHKLKLIHVISFLRIFNVQDLVRVEDREVSENDIIFNPDKVSYFCCLTKLITIVN